MKSAYMTLGLPGNATDQEIEAAFARAQAIYSREKMAADDEVLERFAEVKLAYDVLRNAESRAAHDRKLARGHTSSAPMRVARIVAEGQPSPYLASIKIAAIVTVLVFGVGVYLNHKNEVARRLRDAQELAAKQEQAKDEEARRAHAERLAAELTRSNAQSAADTRRLAVEAQQATDRAASQRRYTESVDMQRQRQSMAEQQRRELALKEEERRNVLEAQRRLAMDKQRIRELCYINYRRYDC